MSKDFAYLDAAPAPLALVAADGTVVHANPAFAAMLDRGAGGLNGMPLHALLAGDATRDAAELLRDARSGETTVSFVLPDGRRVEARLSAGQVTAADGAVAHLLSATPLDSTLPSGLARVVQTFFEKCDEGFLITDDRRRIVHVNHAFTRMTGYSREELVGQDPKILRSDWHDRRFYTEMWRQIAECGRWEGEIRDRRKDGELHVQWLTIQAVRDGSGRITHYFGLLDDAAGKANWQERFNFLAYYDPLTELPNRRLFIDRIAHALRPRRGAVRPVALLLIDIDRFKTINTGYGHPTGDKVLRAVGRRISEALDPRATVARLDADRFAVALDERSEEELLTLTALLLQRLASPIALDGREIDLTGSMGVALHPRDGRDADDLLRNAEAALERARETGNACVFYAPEMNERASGHRLLETKMRRALRNHEFVLHFQPQVDIVGKRLVGAEVLLRWRDPEEGMVSPGDFIPLTEETGLIVPIGEWILRESGAILGRWRGMGERFAGLKLAVNISARQFRDESLTDKIRDAIAVHGVDPARLELEITESAAMSDVDAVTAVLEGMRRESGGLALDDFGTGYSSLSYLKRFPIDKLKIDQSFVRGLLVDEDDTAICRSIIDMAKALRMRVIAEGVETAAQLRFLRENGCLEVQGFLFARPLPLDRFEAFVAAFDYDAAFTAPPPPAG